MAGYYDTTSGPKTEAESYKEISRDAEVPVEQFLFLTDNVKGLSSIPFGFPVVLFADTLSLIRGRRCSCGRHVCRAYG